MLDYMYIPDSECSTCKGKGKTESGFDCPDCEYRHLWQKAEKLKIGTRYVVNEANKSTINRMQDLFGAKCSVHERDWIIKVEQNKVSRINIHDNTTTISR